MNTVLCIHCIFGLSTRFYRTANVLKFRLNSFVLYKINSGAKISRLNKMSDHAGQPCSLSHISCSVNAQRKV